MRIEPSVTSLSWIPSEAIGALVRMPFDTGVTHYDQAPPDAIEDLQALRQADRYRLANQPQAWIEVEGGKIVDCGYSGRGHIGSTTVRLVRALTLPGVAFPGRQHSPAISVTRSISSRQLAAAPGCRHRARCHGGPSFRSPPRSCGPPLD